MADTVPWHPPEPMRGPEEGSGMPRPTHNEELWQPAGRQSRQSRGRELTDCSLDTEDMPGTETEDEAFGLQRRRRSTTQSSRRRAAAPTTEGLPVTTTVPTTTAEPRVGEDSSGDVKSSHRRRRLHAVMSDD